MRRRLDGRTAASPEARTCGSGAVRCAALRFLDALREFCAFERRCPISRRLPPAGTFDVISLRCQRTHSSTVIVVWWSETGGAPSNTPGAGQSRERCVVAPGLGLCDCQVPRVGAQHECWSGAAARTQQNSRR